MSDLDQAGLGLAVALWAHPDPTSVGWGEGCCVRLACCHTAPTPSHVHRVQGPHGLLARVLLGVCIRGCG